MRIAHREFKQTISRLESAFGHRMKNDQLDVWHDKLKNWPLAKLEKVVDILLTTGDKFPALASLFRAGETISNDSILPPKTPCIACEGTGCLTAYRFEEGAKIRPYHFAFRCPACRNWEGRQSERIPMWTTELLKKGYRILADHMDDMTKTDLEALRDLAPKMFNDFLRRHPEWADDFKPVDFEKSSWNQMPAPAKPITKEALDEMVKKAAELSGPPVGPEEYRVRSHAELSQPPESEEEWVPR